MLFPLSLSSVAQSWFATIDASCRLTWEDLAHELNSRFLSALSKMSLGENLRLWGKKPMRRLHHSSPVGGRMLFRSLTVHQNESRLA